jgi:hypothetical protein
MDAGAKGLATVALGAVEKLAADISLALAA